MSGEEMAIKDLELLKSYEAKWAELERNAKYRQEAVQPMVDKLTEINGRLIDLFRAQQISNDLLAELIRRTKW